MKASSRLLVLGFFASLLVTACASGPATVPTPRSVIIFSGERIQTDRETMGEVDSWLRVQREEIERNPSFLIRLQSTTNPGYPWRDFEITGDTAIVFLQQTARDAEAPYLIYAHLRLMASRDDPAELEPWLPEDDLGKEGLDLELAILNRVADVWLLGRSVYDTQAFGPLDEIMYAREAGFLRELVLQARRDRFASEREAHFAAEPDRESEFRSWLERVFERSEPGYAEAAEAIETDEEIPPGPPGGGR